MLCVKGTDAVLVRVALPNLVPILNGVLLCSGVMELENVRIVDEGK
jgi:hypothetical protein